MNAPNFRAVAADIRDVEARAAERAQRQRAEQDIAAAAARRHCFQTHVAIGMIELVPQMFEADVLCLLHAIQRRIELHNMHLPHWQAVCNELADVQSMLDEVIVEAQADAERAAPDPDRWHDEAKDRAVAERFGGF